MQPTGPAEPDCPMDTIPTPFNHVLEVQDSVTILRPIMKKEDKQDGETT